MTSTQEITAPIDAAVLPLLDSFGVTPATYEELRDAAKATEDLSLEIVKGAVRFLDQGITPEDVWKKLSDKIQLLRATLTGLNAIIDANLKAPTKQRNPVTSSQWQEIVSYTGRAQLIIITSQRLCNQHISGDMTKVLD